MNKIGLICFAKLWSKTLNTKNNTINKAISKCSIHLVSSVCARICRQLTIVVESLPKKQNKTQTCENTQSLNLAVQILQISKSKKSERTFRKQRSPVVQVAEMQLRRAQRFQQAPLNTASILFDNRSRKDCSDQLTKEGNPMPDKRCEFAKQAGGVMDGKGGTIRWRSEVKTRCYSRHSRLPLLEKLVGTW